MLIGVGEHIWWNTTQFIGVHSVNFTETTPNFCVIQTTWVQNPYFDLNFLGIWTLQNYPRLKSLAWEPMTWDFKLIKVNYSRGSDRPDLEYRFGLLNGRSGRSVAQKKSNLYEKFVRPTAKWPKILNQIFCTAFQRTPGSICTDTVIFAGEAFKKWRAVQNLQFERLH